MNDLPMFLPSITLFADDTMIEVASDTLDGVIRELQTNIDKLSIWFNRNNLTINNKNLCSMLIGTPHKIKDYCNLATLGLKINGQNLNNMSCYKYLGLTIDSCMTWNKAIIATCKKLGTRVAMTQRFMSFFPQNYVNPIYYAFVQPYIDYGLSIWGNTSKSNIDKVQRLQNRLARIVTNNFNYNISSSVIIRELGWQTVSERNIYLTLLLMFKCMNGSAPVYLSDQFCQVSDVHYYNTRRVANNDLYHTSVYFTQI